jgi:hypothetical protein
MGATAARRSAAAGRGRQGAGRGVGINGEHSITPAHPARPQEAVETPGTERTSHPAPRWRQHWLRNFGFDRYGLLLLMLGADLFLLMVVPVSPAGTFICVPFVAVTLALALRTSQVRRRVQIVARIVAAAAVVLALAQLLSGSTRLTGLTFLLLSLMLVATPVAITRRIFRHTTVDASTLMGALCIYVLIGLVFAFGYLGVNGIDPPFFAQGESNVPGDYVYMSFITMTTTGYGDLTPGTQFGRALVVTETLIGQIYLVTTVARLVTLYSGPRLRGEKNESPPDE